MCKKSSLAYNKSIFSLTIVAVIAIAIYIYEVNREFAKNVESHGELSKEEVVDYNSPKIPNSTNYRESISPGQITDERKEISIYVRSMTTREMIKSSHIKVWSEPNFEMEEFTLSRGTFRIPTGRSILEVGAIGYHDRLEVMNLTESTNIYLIAMGTIEFECINEKGNPVEEVELMVYPPTDSDRTWDSAHVTSELFQTPIERRQHIVDWIEGDRRESFGHLLNQISRMQESSRMSPDILASEIKWKGVSDSNGILKLDIPAMEEVRWGVISTHRIEDFQPPYEEEEFLQEEGGLKYNSKYHPNMSGKFELKPGEKQFFQVVVLENTLLVGRVDVDPYNTTSVVLKVYNVDGVSRKDETPRKIRVEGDGRFSFQLTPGWKTFSASWKQGERDIFFAQAQIYIRKGEINDIGLIESGSSGIEFGIAYISSDSGERVFEENLFERGLRQQYHLLSLQGTMHLSIFFSSSQLPVTLHGLNGKYVIRPIGEFPEPKGFSIQGGLKEVFFETGDSLVYLEIPLVRKE